jgi:hypothetical protein
MPFPITASEISKTETKTGFIFPTGLKLRLSKDNGGEIKVAGDYWQLIPFRDGSDRKRIARTCNDIVSETEKMRSWRGFPQDSFAVAQNGGGDYLIVLPDTDSSKQLGETIFFWDHETCEYEPVADSLDSI